MFKLSQIRQLFHNFIVRRKLFGWKVAFLIPAARIFKWAWKPKHRAILAYLEQKYAPLIEQYKSKQSSDNGIIAPDCPIWVCWFQGEEQMPPLVKRCYSTIIKYSGNHPVRLIQMDNFRKYVSIPQYVLDKVKNKELSLTHLSDVLRINLLAIHGGIWLDATIFLTAPLKTFELPFFSLKQNMPQSIRHIHVTEFRWTTFCLGGVKGNILYSFLRDMIHLYIKQEKIFIDYFLFDYLIAIGYRNIPAIRSMIDAVPYSNHDLWYLRRHISAPVNEQSLQEVLQRTFIYKLSYKVPMPSNPNALYYYLGLAGDCEKNFISQNRI